MVVTLHTFKLVHLFSGPVFSKGAMVFVNLLIASFDEDSM